MNAIPKQNPWRCKRYTDAAAGQSCVRCGATDGTIVACHYSGFRQHLYGKGARIKGTDIGTADLCQCCHDGFDGYGNPNTITRSEEFLHCILLTQIRRLAAGILKA